MLIYTDHAKERMQQRGIPELAIELINRYGTVRHTKGGRYRYFDNQNKKKVKKAKWLKAKKKPPRRRTLDNVSRFRFAGIFGIHPLPVAL